VSAVTRRTALAVLFGAAPVVALAAQGGRIRVDVSPLRRNGDNTDADYLAEFLPSYLGAAFGPGHDVAVRIESVYYGPPGSNGQQSNMGAVDVIEGVGRIDGREVPLTCTVQATVTLPDIGGYAARQRQDQLARSFAYWLPGQVGIWR
jgi:hypothetical protein